MKFLMLITITLLSCKGHKYIEAPYFSREDQIDTLIASQAGLIKECQEWYSLTRNEHGGDDSATLTYFCDTNGIVSMIRVINFYSTKETFKTYFSKGKMVKITVEYFRKLPYYQEHSDYYIDHDTLLLKVEGSRSLDVNNWISLNKKYYNDYSPIR